MIDTFATVESNRELATGYRLLTLDFKENIEVLPGQFAMLKATGAIEPRLRRAAPSLYTAFTVRDGSASCIRYWVGAPGAVSGITE